MPVSTSLTHLVLLVSFSATAFAAPHPISSLPLSMNLHRRVPQPKSADDIAAWAKAHKLNVEAKYGNPSSSVQKRSTSAQSLIVNQGSDSSFFGSIAVGTPPVAYDVILDTGSADLWLASSTCTSSSCEGIKTFEPSTSSTFNNNETSFSITYGSGEASGTLGNDIVQMAGFAVSNQMLAVCDEVSTNLLNDPVSGLMGLAFQTIASSGAVPFWETLASSGAWSEPLMAFQLTRYTNDSTAQELEPGGTFTLGATNTSLYTGDINFNDIPNGEATYWLQTISGVTSQGSSITTPTGSSALAAIDTGTTLIAGPSSSIAEIYAQIPGSQAGTGNLEGYYTYPCSTTVETTLSFGGQSWPISNADFAAEQLNEDTCLGAFFEVSTGGEAPAWIVGDSFLKNVYSVFRYSPPSVGFAQLSPLALSMNGITAPIPTATIASPIATVSANDDIVPPSGSSSGSVGGGAGFAPSTGGAGGAGGGGAPKFGNGALGRMRVGSSTLLMIGVGMVYLLV